MEHVDLDSTRFLVTTNAQREDINLQVLQNSGKAVFFGKATFL